MLCGACGSAFEVETGGARICLTVAPLGTSTAGVLDTWLTPTELRLALARAQAAPAPAASPFEELAAATPPAATPPVAPTQQDANPAAVVMLAELVATEAVAPAEDAARAEPEAVGDANPPLAMPLPSNGAPTAAAPEPEPGSDDWFASLAAVIGGVTPVKPPSDEVLADELERLLTTRAESGANGAGEHAPEGAPAAEPHGALPVQPASPTTAGMDETEEAALALAPTKAAAAHAPATPDGAAAATLATPAADLPAPGPAVLAAPVDPGAAVSASAAAAASTAATLETAAAAPDVMAPQTAMTALKVSVLAEPSLGGVSTSAPVSRRELAERAWKLHELGNSLPSIQAALESQGGTPDDISTIMAKLVALEQARRDRFQRNLYWAIGIAAGVIMLLLAIAIVLSLSPAPAASGPSVTAVGTASAAQIGTPAPGQTTTTTVTAPTATLTFNPFVALLNQLIPGDVKIANGPPPTPMPTSSLFGGLFPAAPTAAVTETPSAATPGATSSSGLPAWVATLVPHGITVLNVPTPSVDHSGPPAGPCPTTPAQAAALFGGAPGNWTFNREEQGWIFILASSPATLKLPSGMSAGYLVIGDQLEMRSTTGPATIHNVNFAAVSCS